MGKAKATKSAEVRGLIKRLINNGSVIFEAYSHINGKLAIDVDGETFFITVTKQRLKPSAD